MECGSGPKIVQPKIKQHENERDYNQLRDVHRIQSGSNHLFACGQRT